MIRQLFGVKVNEALKVLSHEKPFYKRHGRIIKKPEDKKDYFNAVRHSPVLTRRVKLADRLHNLLTLDFCTPEKQVRKLKETREYILPIAQETDIRFYKTIKSKCDYWERKI